MSYLRFTPDDYRNLAHVCSRLNLHRSQPRQFKRLLIQDLRYVSPSLAQRIVAFRWTELRLVFDHFAVGACPTTEGIPKDPLHEFDLLELMMIAEECAAGPFPIRFIRQFKRVLVERLLESWPILAGKLSWLSGHQFERLFKQVSERGHRSR